MQWFIDVRGFFGLLACSAGQSLFFTASEVNQLQLGDSDIIGVFEILGLNCQRENTMTPRGHLIQIVARENSIPRAEFIQI